MKFMSYRYLGYGITDNNGEAKLEYDENGNHLDHSITGTGAGELDIVASLDKPISSGSIVSETYSIIDAKFIDIATTGKKNTNDWITPSTTYYTEVTSDTGTVQTNTASNNIWFKANDPSTSSTSEYDWSAPLKIEFDNLGTDGTTFQIFDGASGVISFYAHSYQNKHISITITDSTYTIKNETDNTIIGSGANPFTSNFAIRYAIAGGKTFEYKNFVIYPI